MFKKTVYLVKNNRISVNIWFKNIDALHVNTNNVYGILFPAYNEHKQSNDREYL